MDATRKEISRIGEFYNKSSGRNVLSSGSAILQSMNYQSISQQGQDMVESIFSRKTMVPLSILSMLFFIQSWSGAIVVFFFGVSIFQVLFRFNISLFYFCCHILFLLGKCYSCTHAYNILLIYRKLEYLLMHTMRLLSLG